MVGRFIILFLMVAMITALLFWAIDTRLARIRLEKENYLLESHTVTQAIYISELERLNAGYEKVFSQVVTWLGLEIRRDRLAWTGLKNE